MPDGPVAWPDAHDMLLAVHVAAGSLGLLLGPFVIWAERWPPYQSRAGAAYCWSILVVSLTALALVAFDAPALWWLVPLAVLAYGLALVGRLAPRRRARTWVRAYTHGQGGSYIALATALLVVSLDGPASVAAWVVPTLVGLVLIERRARRLSAVNGVAAADRPPLSDRLPAEAGAGNDQRRRP